MPVRILSAPYHIGSPLPVDLTAEPHLRLEGRGGQPSGLSDDLGPVADVGLVIRDAVYDAMVHSETPLLWAGDCLAPIAVVAGIQRAGVDPSVIWFDAHGDFNTSETSWTGYLPGMSLAMLVGRGDQSLPRELGTRSISEDRVVLVDGRRLDPKEAELISQSRITHVPLDRVDAALGATQCRIYLHVDVDVVDPGEMPAMRYRAFHGPSLEQVLQAVRRVVSTGRVCAMSVGITLEDDHPDAARAVSVASALHAVLTSGHAGRSARRPTEPGRLDNASF